MALSIAIIGAGVCGATLSYYLRDHASVTIFEKARGAGGRSSCRYADAFNFDHGAPYITARSDAFKAFLSPLIEEGLLAEWNPRVTTLTKGQAPYKRDLFEPHYVAVPRMNDFVKHIIADTPLHKATRIADISREANKWRLTTDNEENAGLFDMVMCTAPSPQAFDLMPEICGFRDAISEATMTGAYSLMIGLHDAPEVRFDMAICKESPIAKIIINSSKPGRLTEFSLLAQTGAAWSEDHLEDDQEEVKALLTQEISELTGMALPSNPAYHALHRWRYAGTGNALNTDYLADTDNGLFVAGDWCIGGGMEDAFLSAYRLAKKLLQQHT